MGVVYAARHERLDLVRAVKLLSPHLANDLEFRARFEREWRLAATIQHPNIVEVLDAGEDDGRLYVVMRLIDGVDLSELLRKDGSLQPSRCVRLLAQIADALDAAHTQDLVHRDVTPRNILVTSNGTAYLADFGIARKAGSTGFTRAGHFVGNLDYAAPEQIEGKAVDRRADVYALGGVLHTCLSGALPYERESDMQVAYAHLHLPPPSPRSSHPELPLSIDHVVARAMAKSPADRYRTCRELVSALDAAMNEDALLQQAETDPQPAVAISTPLKGSATELTQPATGRMTPITELVRDVRPRRPSSKARVLVALVILVAAALAAILMLTGGSPAPIAAEPQDGYRFWNAVCDFGIAGGRSCVDPENANDAYRWGYRQGSGFRQHDDWGYGYRSSMSYMAWRLHSLGISAAKFTGLGSGGQWAARAHLNGVPAGATARVGAAAVAPAAPDRLGQVAFVEAVNHGRITVSEFNRDGAGHGDTWTGAPSTRGFSKYVYFDADPTMFDDAERSKGDFDGDGRSDIAMLVNTADGGTAVMVASSNGAGFKDPVRWATIPRQQWEGIKLATADFNGDGRSDIAMLVRTPDGKGSSLLVATSKGSSFGAPGVWWTAPALGWGGIKIVPGDFNGDGRYDLAMLVRLSTRGSALLVATSIGTDFNPPKRWWTGRTWAWAGIKLTQGNFNGDTRSDVAMLVVPRTGGSALMVATSTGTKFNRPESWWTGPSWGWDGIKLIGGQFDGKGGSDVAMLIQPLGRGSALWVATSNGSSFDDPVPWWTGRALGWDGIKLVQGFFDSDRKSDIAMLVRAKRGTALSVVTSNAGAFSKPLRWWTDPNWGWGGIRLG
jgi:surface antigen